MLHLHGAGLIPITSDIRGSGIIQLFCTLDVAGNRFKKEDVDMRPSVCRDSEMDYEICVVKLPCPSLCVEIHNEKAERSSNY